MPRTKKTYLEKELEDPKIARDFYQESLILNIGEEIVKAMEREGITRRQLVNRLRRLGYKYFKLKQILTGEKTPNLQELSDIFFVMGRELILSEKKINHG